MTTPFDPNDATCCDGVFGLPHSADDARVVLLPVPFDATTSYRQGAADGPETILEASWQVDLRDVETGDPWKQGIVMLPEAEHIDGLNDEARALAAPIQEQEDEQPNPEALERVNAIGEEVASWVEAETKRWHERDKIVGVVGGDHASPLGAIVAAAARWPGLGVLHFDAHADLRVAYQGFTHSHASIMHNVLERAAGVKRIVQVGVRDLCAAEMDVIERSDRVACWYDSDLSRAQFEGRNFSSVAEEIVNALPGQVWISFDVDGLDPSLCPSTGTPVPGGLSFQQATYLIGAVARSGRRIVGFDLCEVAPGPDPTGIDGIVGARILYKLIGWSLHSAGLR